MHDAHHDGDDVPAASINVTPFVDVVLVLLVIFMVTSDFIRPSGIDVQLPRAASGGADARRKEANTEAEQWTG